MEKLRFASLPTPIHFMENLSETLKRKIWIKRDDFTGVEYSGNKARKLEYLFYEAKKGGCDYILTTGGKQSNHVRATSAIAAKFGFSCILFLVGVDDGMGSKGNLLLNRLFGAEVIFVQPDKSSEITDIMKKKAEELTSNGHKAYIIPTGGSTPIGARGYMECMSEIKEFEGHQNINFDLIAHATGSGGTYAGLILGDNDKYIVGYSCSGSSEYFVETIYNIAREIQADIPKSKINIVDDYAGPEYGVSTPEAVEFIKYLARVEGIVLDTCYTGKAFYGLISDIKKGKYANCENILFIHTGGIFSVFADEALEEK